MVIKTSASKQTLYSVLFCIIMDSVFQQSLFQHFNSDKVKNGFKNY